MPSPFPPEGDKAPWAICIQDLSKKSKLGSIFMWNQTCPESRIQLMNCLESLIEYASKNKKAMAFWVFDLNDSNCYVPVSCYVPPGCINTQDLMVSFIKRYGEVPGVLLPTDKTSFYGYD